MIAVGVDTHKHEHLAVRSTGSDSCLGEPDRRASLAGYTELTQWLRTLADECCRRDRGHRQLRRRALRVPPRRGDHCRGGRPSPPRRIAEAGSLTEIDALLAAKKVLANDGLSTPRAGGTRQALAALLVAQRSCVGERTRLLNQFQALHITAPIALRERIGEGNGTQARPQRPAEDAHPPATTRERAMHLRRPARPRPPRRELAAHAERYEHELAL